MEMNSKQLIIKGQVKTLTFEECYHQFTALRYSFFHKWRRLNVISEEDIEQEINIALYKAYERYDLSYGVEFVTSAYTTINMCMMNLYRDTKRAKRKENYTKVSLDETINNYKNINNYETHKKIYGVEAIRCYEDYSSVEINLMISKRLNDKENKIVKLLYQGYTQQEIADILGCSQVSVCRYKNKIGEKLKAIS